jgi:hypothetical protein
MSNRKHKSTYEHSNISKIYILNRYLKKFGNISLASLLIKVQGDKLYQCPNCDGLGTVEEEEILTSNDGDMGYWRTIICYVCHGDGYLDKEKKPKMEQIGWE